jgi:hypothetical protein
VKLDEWMENVWSVGDRFRRRQWHPKSFAVFKLEDHSYIKYDYDGNRYVESNLTVGDTVAEDWEFVEETSDTSESELPEITISDRLTLIEKSISSLRSDINFVWKQVLSLPQVKTLPDEKVLDMISRLVIRLDKIEAKLNKINYLNGLNF